MPLGDSIHTQNATRPPVRGPHKRASGPFFCVPIHELLAAVLACALLPRTAALVLVVLGERAALDMGPLLALRDRVGPRSLALVLRADHPAVRRLTWWGCWLHGRLHCRLRCRSWRADLVIPRKRCTAAAIYVPDAV